MKNQYFGDINDFSKYGLLRALKHAQPLKLGVYWMLTPDDGTAEGGKVEYLNKREFRSRDPELFDWLSTTVVLRGMRNVKELEASSLLGDTLFFSETVSDNAAERKACLNRCSELFADRELIFFDPDNGLEVSSVPRGRMDSSKYLYWDELVSFFQRGASLLVFQHFSRENRDEFIQRRLKELADRCGKCSCLAVRCRNVVYLLALQEQHRAMLQQRVAAIHSDWNFQFTTTNT